MRTYLPFGIAAVVIAAIQIVASLTNSEFYLTQLIMTAYYTLVVIGLTLLMGYAGQVSLGHAGFFAIGGYCAAVLTTMDVSGWGISGVLLKTGLGISGTDSWGASIVYLNPWLSIAAALLVSAALALLIGIPALRLKGHYLAMATLSFGIIIYRIVLGSRLFGEADGIGGVPAFELLPGLVVSGRTAVRVPNYYVAWILVLLGALLVHNLIRSRPGRALRSIHGNEEAARAMGVDVDRYKLNLFVISALFASVAGAFLTHYNGGIGPSESGVMKSVRYVAIVAVGGMDNLWGALISSLILNFLSLRGYFGTHDDAVFGITLVAMMLFAPNGFLRRRMSEKKRRADAAA